MAKKEVQENTKRQVIEKALKEDPNISYLDFCKNYKMKIHKVYFYSTKSKILNPGQKKNTKKNENSSYVQYLEWVNKGMFSSIDKMSFVNRLLDDIKTGKF